MRILRTHHGQGLVEYIILVALIAVATMGLVRILQTAINAGLANVVYSLEGGSGSNQHRRRGETVTDDMLRKKDFSDFVNGAVSR